MDTAIAAAWTEYAETQTAIPTGTPTFIPPTTVPGPYSIIPPNPDQQVYIDPDGWYSVNFPADMKPTDKPNSFSRLGAFFETGYLPEMGYVSRAITVCTWLANIESNPEQSTINWMPPCSVSIKTNQWQTITYQIFENPAADPQHHFIYIKTDLGYPWADHEYLKTTLSLLRPVYSITAQHLH